MYDTKVQNFSYPKSTVAGRHDKQTPTQLSSKTSSAATSFQSSLVHNYFPSSHWASWHGDAVGQDLEPQPTPRRNWSYRGVDWWLWELVSVGVATTSMAVMAVLLAVYDNQRLPSTWFLGINLNAHISILAAVGKFYLAVPVNEALGQLKWLWFHGENPRNLTDFERFDDASRGPLGSLALILRTKCRSLAALGASITLLSFVLDPIFQQLVAYPERPVMSSQSSVPRSIRFRGLDQSYKYNGTTFTNADATMTVVVEPYFLGNASDHPIDAFCPTGDCSWAPFETLGVCSACADVSSLLEFGCFEDTGAWRSTQSVPVTPAAANQTIVSSTVSCGYFINATSKNPMLMAGYAIDANTSTPLDGLLMRQIALSHRVLPDSTYFDGSISFTHINNPLVDFITVAQPDAAALYANNTPAATECSLQYCVKTIEASYSHGVYSENVTSVYTDTSNLTSRDDYHVIAEGGTYHVKFFRNITLQPPTSNTTYTIDNVTHVQNFVMYHIYLPGYLTVSNTSSTPELSFFNDDADDWAGYNQQVQDMTYDGFLPPTNVTKYIGDMATGMTNVMRTYKTGTELVYGPGVLETFVRVQWGWFTFPLILLFGSAAFLAGTIIQSRGRPIWKNSAIAVLANGLDDAAQNRFRPSIKLSEMFKQAGELEVSYVSSEKAFSVSNEAKSEMGTREV